MVNKAKYFTLKKHFVGLPTDDDFELIDQTLPDIADGEILVESLYLSVDPYMRPYSQKMKEGTKMIGTGVGRILESKSEKFQVGALVTGPFGWATHIIADKTLLQSVKFRLLPSKMEHISYALGALGLTGMTAYFGFLDICTPKEGETVFVNAAAGATGSFVGQIAKIKGCRVVGCAGSDTKVQFLKEIGFDGAFNYKTSNFEEKIKELCPKGVDCFFDNVGGSQYDTVMKNMNRFGRIALCGSISSYNEGGIGAGVGPYVHLHAIGMELKLQGFLAPSFYGRFEEAFKDLSQWIKEDKIKVREVVVDGFDKMPGAFISLFQGENIGKVVVKVK